LVSPRASECAHVNGEIKRRTEVVGIFRNEAPSFGALRLAQNDEWAVRRARYMTLETIAPLSDDPIVNLPAIAGRSARPWLANAVSHRQLHHVSRHDQFFTTDRRRFVPDRSARRFP
jgi:hypothetical protein